MANETFAVTDVVVITGDANIAADLLKTLDYIFSRKCCCWLQKQRQKILTPTLELGGKKSPVIVDETANLELSAKRIVWANHQCWSTPVAPDSGARKTHKDTDNFVTVV
jgi:aldehyde dehydrogenase (NAD+)